MRGPSSSHTAGAFYIGTLARALLADEPATVKFAFDPNGSFAKVYRQQGSELGFSGQFFKHTFGDKNMPAGQSKSIYHFMFESGEVKFPIRPVADAGDSLAYTVNIILQTRIVDFSAQLLFNLRSIFATYLDILAFRNQHKLLFAGYRIDCTADEQTRSKA